MNNKNYIVVLIVILSILAVGLTSFMLYAIYNNKNFPNFNFTFKDKSVKVLDEEYSLENIKEIYFDFDNHDITVNKSDNDKLRVVVYSDDEKPMVSLIDDKISITNEKNKSVCFGFCFYNNRIEIYIPDGYDKLLNVNSISGDILIKENFDLIDLNIVSISGDIDIKNVEIANLKTTSGDIQAGDIIDADISTVSGDVDINNVSGKVKIKTTSGDIYISSIDLKDNGSINTISGDVVIGSSNVHVDTSTISGNVDINKNGITNYILNVGTTSGDINVN